ncbi:hypothetical protein G4B88_027765 [Cannabis sativa]|uniref:Uncharacterized protein n=1 Tax=Cannabis sativa TaxID=3483 RepID=A0A7J6DXJ3_CANSA|nr:hypothetical protein G4B88_027765 [Cannabis sativa]
MDSPLSLVQLPYLDVVVKLQRRRWCLRCGNRKCLHRRKIVIKHDTHLLPLSIKMLFDTQLHRFHHGSHEFMKLFVSHGDELSLESFAIGWSIMFLSTWKALARTSGLMGGSEPNTAFAMVITPAFRLLRAAKATAGVCPLLN